MDRFKYLTSEHLILWWNTDLCELNDEIERGDSGRLSAALRVDGFAGGAEFLEREVKDLDENCFLHLREDFETSMTMDKVKDSVYERASIVKTSLEVLKQSMANAKLRDVARLQMQDNDSILVNLRSQDVINDSQFENFDGISVI
jgi:hypothetical protein